MLLLAFRDLLSAAPEILAHCCLKPLRRDVAEECLIALRRSLGSQKAALLLLLRLRCCGDLRSFLPRLIPLPLHRFFKPIR